MSRRNESRVPKFKELQFNSFILGSSRAESYDAKYWEENYLDKTERGFLLNASGKNLLGINQKIKYIDNQNIKLKNVILTFDMDSLREKKKVGFLMMQSPVLSSSKDAFDFYLAHLKTFMNPKFLVPFFLSKITDGKICNTEFNKFVLNNKKISFDPSSNSKFFSEVESLINKNPEQFYGQEKFKIKISKKSHKDDASGNY